MKIPLLLLAICYYAMTQAQNAELEVQGDFNLSGGLNFSGFSTNTGNDYELLLPGIDISSGDVPTGLIVSFLVSASNTGSATLKVDNGASTSTARHLLRRGNLQLGSDDLIAGEIAMAIFNGLDWQLMHPASTIPSYLSNCNGTYVNLLTDAAYCGSCNIACPAGYRCDNGNCVLSCQNGLTNCNGTCINLNANVSNCGTCGNDCPAGYRCEGGNCVLSCEVGLTKCSGTCVNLNTDLYHCGTCGITCEAGERCVSGNCVLSCGVGLTNCAGKCTDLQSDNQGCGTCGNVCPTGFKCENGSCVACDD